MYLKYKFMKALWVFIVFGFALPFLQAQISFSSGNLTYLPNHESHSGIAGGFADVNGDLYDDLIILNKSKFLEVGINQGQNKELKWTSPLFVNANEEYALAIGDFNNDFLSEIIIGGIHSGTKIYTRKSDGEYYLSQNISRPIYTQSTNTVDFDNDGYLDYFACNDEASSLLLKNINGNLTITNLIDFNTIPVSDNSGSYGSEWADVDNDGDQDLYIAKCRFGVNDIEDPRRHNMLFINYGDHFVNEAEERGMKHKGQSWTGSFADFDNDGDQDCIITNHDMPHALMQNDGTGHFTELALDEPLTATFAFQSLWADFDNNGFLDFLITGADQTFFYLNTDGKHFTKISQTFDQNMNSATLGDINDDGFIDVASYYGIGINLAGPRRDEIWVNHGNDHHYVKFALKGNLSNAQGIGARLELYGPWGLQTREIRAGLSYGVSNSLTQHFGLGSSSHIDSLIVRWPSGTIDVYNGLAIDQTFLVNEGKCISPRIELIADKNLLCEGDSVRIMASGDFNKYVWSNGDTTRFTYVSEPTTLLLKMTDESGCDFLSKSISIEKGKPTSIINNGRDTLFFCTGSEIQLSAQSDLLEYVWSTGSIAKDISVSEEGWIGLAGTNSCETIFDSVYVDEVNTRLIIENDTVKKGETATLKVNGENVHWYADIDRQNVIHIGNELSIINLQNDMTYFVESKNKAGIKKTTMGEKNLPATNQYSADNVDAGLYINVYKDLLLESFTVASDKEGVRRFLIISYEGDTVFTKDVFIYASDGQDVTINAPLKIGTYYQLKTDQDINLQNFGHKAPRFVRTADNTHYPYGPQQIAEIPNSIKGQASYYYFYNIRFETSELECTGQLQEISAIIDTTTGTKNTTIDKFFVYPNPVQDILQVQGEGMFSINDVHGRQLIILPFVAGEKSVNVSSLPAALYFVTVIDKSGSRQVIKFVKTDQ